MRDQRAELFRKESKMLVTLKLVSLNGYEDLSQYFPDLDFKPVTKTMHSKIGITKTWVLNENVVELNDPMQFMKDNASLEIDEYTAIDPPYDWIIEFMGDQYPYDATLTLYSNWVE